MRIFTSALMATTMLVLAGCSTTALNPNYQQTTIYKGSNPYGDAAVVQQAGYETQAAAPVTYVPQANYDPNYLECISKESNRKILGATAGGVVGAIAGRSIAGDNKTLGTVAGAALGGAAGYGIADKTIACERAPVVVRQNAPIYQAVPQAVTYEAPSGIEENTASVGEGGTPGYYAVNGIEPPATSPQIAQPQLAQAQTLQPQQVLPTTEPLLEPKIAAVPASAVTMHHTVNPGDTLYSLARTACSTVAEIQSLNTINSKFYIRAGDDILLPSGRCAE